MLDGGAVAFGDQRAAVGEGCDARRHGEVGGYLRGSAVRLSAGFDVVRARHNQHQRRRQRSRGSSQTRAHRHGHTPLVPDRRSAEPQNPRGPVVCGYLGPHRTVELRAPVGPRAVAAQLQCPLSLGADRALTGGLPTLVVLTTVGASLLQCSPAPPPATGDFATAIDRLSRRRTTVATPPQPGSAVRPPGHRRRTRRELAAGLPRRTGAAAAGRGRLRRFRRADAPRRADRAPRPGRRRHRDLRATASDCAIPSPRCARSTTIRAPTMSCRWKTTTPRRSTADPCPPAGRWSLHAYGRAIDREPAAQSLHRQPRAPSSRRTAAPYLDRNRTDPGILHAGDPAVRVFTDRGWRWGGNWRTPKDYQHFERPVKLTYGGHLNRESPSKVISHAISLSRRQRGGRSDTRVTCEVCWIC